MRSKKISRKLCLCGLGILVCALVNAQALVADLDREVHAPILIQGNEQFTPENGITGGSGVAGDPYIIEGWEIDASTAHGIHIMNTTAYFIARNCYIEDGGNDHHGIYLENVRNGRIEDTTTSNNYYGIYLWYSDDNDLTGNTASNNYAPTSCGIYLYNSDNNTLTNNEASNNSWFGIWLDAYSDNNNLTNNIVSQNSDGIFLWYSANNTLDKNTASHNYHGINLEDSSDNILTSNSVLHNSYGIGLWPFSNNNRLISNNASRNSNWGIYLDGACNNTLANNTASDNFHGILFDALFSWSSNNNALTGNIVSNNSFCGIAFNLAYYNILTGNIVSNNSSYGIMLVHSNSNILYNNYFSNAHNAYDNRHNTWNIDPPIQGHNIVGGPYLGGNYWSDYQGEDLDGDWLGDTELPYKSNGGIANGGDYHPLIPYTWPPDVEELNLGPIPE